MTSIQEQKYQLNKLIDYRDNIYDAVFHLQRILKTYFPDEYDVAYQHWIPQILTALNEDDRWLSRGERTVQQSIDRLTDKLITDSDKGVSKYIK